jgi:hypothetical protein
MYLSRPADAESIGDAIDVVKPRRYERYLQDRCVVKPSRSQPVEVSGRDLYGIAR